MAVASARMKVRLPGLDSNMAMNLPFIVTGLVQLSLPNALCVGMVSTFVQCLPGRGKQMNAIQATFNVCTVANTIGLSFLFGSYVAKAALIRENRRSSSSVRSCSFWLTAFRLPLLFRPWETERWGTYGPK